MHSYMHRADDSDVTVVADHFAVLPITCKECPITGRDLTLNPSQMLDHLVLVHQERGDEVYEGLEGDSRGIAGVRTVANVYKHQQQRRNARRKAKA